MAKTVINRKLRPVVNKIIKENNITEDQFNEIINSPYCFTKDTIDAIDLSEVTEEDFNKLETNFIYKFIGKFYTDYRSVKATQLNRSKHLKHSKWKK